VKPAPFDYAAPETIEETLALLGEYGADAKLLAGGQSLMPLLNMRLARPSVLIDLNRVSALDYVKVSDGEVRIGALTRQRAAERSPVVAKHLPLMTEADGRKLAKSRHAVALDPIRAASTLWAALEWLRQKPPARLQRATVREVWDWAIPNWRPERLAGCRELRLPAPG